MIFNKNNLNFAKWMLAMLFGMSVTIYIMWGYLAIQFYNEGNYIWMAVCILGTIYGAFRTRKMIDDLKMVKEKTKDLH